MHERRKEIEDHSTSICKCNLASHIDCGAIVVLGVTDRATSNGISLLPATAECTIKLNEREGFVLLCGDKVELRSK